VNTKGEKCGHDLEDPRKLELLEVLVDEPEVRQVDLATRLGVAAGTVNWLIKRLVSKGYIKVKRVGQWRWRYLLTPQGIAEKARLTELYIHDSMSVYRRTRQEARMLLGQVRAEGCTRVYVDGGEKNDLVDVCRLTCLEQDVKIAIGEEGRIPVLRVEGHKLTLEWPTARIIQRQMPDTPR